jgi:hypothetical protein
MAALCCALAGTSGAQPVDTAGTQPPGAAGARLAASAEAQPVEAGVPRKNPFDRPRGIVALAASRPAAAAVPPDLELRATLTGADRAMANIDGEILSLGDNYLDYRVAAIAESRVVLTKNGERLVLELRPDAADDD